ncbi:MULTISPECIES: bestrophin family protein [Rufibacter]|uniref:Putative membrane protein n=1 Tax=Rufibacter quisquiliarum TaxID=1549639 RepID=A0A839GM97_9BACT|nr:MULTISPECIES: bestrophin family ion channel [Rufibacter]MBA9076057.1 putative membrane protein [Rufibacter quisquiliarum]
MLLAESIPYRYIFNMVKVDVLRVFLFSLSFHIIKLIWADDWPPVPSALPSVLGTGISLLLAFNLNQSYERWWEARIVWGAIVNDSRSLLLELKAYISPEKMEDPSIMATFRKIGFRQIAWCYSLGQSLRKEDATAHLHQFLPEQELAYIQDKMNKPLSLQVLHMQDLNQLFQHQALNQMQQTQVASTVVRLVDSMGKAERINTTVFPATYSMFIHFFIYLFLVILSVTLVEAIGIYEIPVLTAVASTFFLVEKTARHIQDPFRNKPTDTPVTAIARTIEINLKQILDEKEVPQPLQPDGYFLM